MGTVFLLTLRQLGARSRFLILTLLAALPLAFAMIIVWDSSAATVADFETILLSGMFAGTIAPLIVLSVSTVAFGNEVEDRTLANLVLTPLPRWKLVLPKVGGAAAVALPFVLVSAFGSAWIGFNHDRQALTAVLAGALVALLVYATLFTWLGLAIRQAMGVGLLYIVLWEGLFAGYVSGIRFLSVRHYGMAVMHGVDARRFASASHVPLWVALTVTGAAVVVLLWATTRRLSRMDVP